MITQSNDTGRPGALQRFQDIIVMTLAGGLIFAVGLFFIPLFILSAVLAAPFAAYHLGRLRRKIMQSSEYEYYVTNFDRDPNVIDGKYTVLDR